MVVIFLTVAFCGDEGAFAAAFVVELFRVAALEAVLLSSVALVAFFTEVFLTAACRGTGVSVAVDLEAPDVLRTGAFAGAFFAAVFVTATFFAGAFAAAFVVAFLAAAFVVVLAALFFVAGLVAGFVAGDLLALVFVAGEVFAVDFFTAGFFAAAFLLVEEVAFVVAVFAADLVDAAALTPPPVFVVDLLVTPEVTRLAAAAVFPASFFAVDRAMAAGPPISMVVWRSPHACREDMPSHLPLQSNVTGKPVCLPWERLADLTAPQGVEGTSSPCTTTSDPGMV
ncbi:MAG TPA: hypothetical protein VK204_06315 [Nocardioidaceae bacterium]|nr:hypothetical protein [Nocardioidaceae bacterium]